jgi:hypothetical protein
MGDLYQACPYLGQVEFGRQGKRGTWVSQQVPGLSQTTKPNPVWSQALGFR